MKSFKLSKKQIYLILPIFIILFTSLSYIPGLEKLKNIGTILIILLPLVNINVFIKIIIRNFKIYFFSLFILIYFVIITLINREGILIDFRFFISFLVTFSCIKCIQLDKESKHKLFFISSIAVLITSYLIILSYYSNIFHAIKNIGIYFYDKKNAFGPLLAVSNIYFFYLYIYECKKINLLWFVLGITSLLIIQARTNVLGVIVVMLFLYVYKFKASKNKLIYIVLGILGVIFFKDIIINVVNKTLRLDYLAETNNVSLNGILSGRNSSWEYGFEYLKENIFLGMNFKKDVMFLNDPSSISGIHNIWFRAIIYGGISYFIIYITYIYQILRNVILNSKEIIGTKVVIHNKNNNKGKIEIEYYSQDDFERIIELIKK